MVLQLGRIERRQIDRRPDPKRLDDTAGERLAYRVVVEYPIEIRRVPQRRETNRCGGRLVVGHDLDIFCEQGIAAAPESVEAAKPGRRRRLVRRAECFLLYARALLARFSKALQAFHHVREAEVRSPRQHASDKRGPLQGIGGIGLESLAEALSESLDVVVRRTALEQQRGAMVVQLTRVARGAGQPDPVPLPALERPLVEANLGLGKADR